MAPAYRGRSDRLPASLLFRSATDDDLPFLLTLYASTRDDEMRVLDWTDEQKTEFLTQQFNAQNHYYHEQFPQAEYLVLEDRGKAIGRIYLNREPDQLRLIDIALVPEARNQGLGEALLLDLLDEAQAAALPVRIHVEQFNPAMRLYLRLGFEPIEDQGVYQLMEWRPARMQERKMDPG